MRIFRYFCSEVLLTTAAIWIVMLVILLFSQSAVYLGFIAKGSIAVSYLGKLLLLNVPFLSSYILPFAFYFGVLLAYGRLYADSEMVVLQASGLSNVRISVYTMLQGVVIFLLTAYLIFNLNPEIINQKGKILQFSSTDVLRSIIPGEFKSINDGKIIVYVGQSNHNRTEFQHVFVAELTHPGSQPSQDEWAVSYLAKANQVTNYNQPYLQIQNGYQYQGVPGMAKYSMLKYDTYSARIPDTAITQEYTRYDGMSTAQLWQLPDMGAQSELQWRIALVLQVIVLALFAIPLSRVKPRQGRFGMILPAVLFYFIYLNLLFLSRYLFENHLSNPVLGIQWVHLVMLVIFLLYYWLVARLGK